LATFWTCEGRLCRPLLLFFLPLLGRVPDLTNPPYFGSVPCYSATFASHRA
jgi:hypothetical protein